MAERAGNERLLEELRLLLDVLAGKAEEYLRGCEPRTGAEDTGAGCGWCPLCAAMALARGQRPELNDQLLGLVQLLRQALVEHAPSTPEPAESEQDTQDASKVQRIQVRRIDGPVLADSDARC